MLGFLAFLAGGGRIDGGKGSCSRRPSPINFPHSRLYPDLHPATTSLLTFHCSLVVLIDPHVLPDWTSVHIIVLCCTTVSPVSLSPPASLVAYLELHTSNDIILRSGL